MLLYANAKINIGLHILDRRKDNYHNIESLFYPVALSDMVEIVESDTFTKLNISGIREEGDDKRNLCLKAYETLSDRYKLAPVNIHLHKFIPIGSGLGGGSSDAVATFKILNSLFELGIDDDELKVYAQEVGSDCSFFIKNEPAFAYSKGEILEPAGNILKDYYIVIIKTDLSISTAEAYSYIKTDNTREPIKELVKLPVKEWKKVLFNDFEKNIFIKYPVLDIIKEQLYSLGAVYASMTGSGSAIYGIFKDEPDVTPYKIYKFYWKSKLI